jgi:DNA-binding LytR/AlgR family response regulator
MRMRVIIIEDNIIDMENLRILLQGFDGFDLVGTASTIEAGLLLAQEKRPDLILLDIQVGRENSLEHIRSLDFTPWIICTTLYDDHALEAFDIGANGYLMKPVTQKKLTQALNRLPATVDEKPDDSVLLSTGTTTRIVRLNEILLVSADRDYTNVLDQDGNQILCNRRMRDWIQLLPEESFSSLDRSTIVNWAQISQFTRLNAERRAKITFMNGHSIQIGPTAFSRLLDVIQSRDVSSEEEAE